MFDDDVLSIKSPSNTVYLGLPVIYLVLKGLDNHSLNVNKPSTSPILYANRYLKEKVLHDVL